MVGLSGKRFPEPMAIVPASLVSVMVTSAGLQVVRGFPADGWATTAPGPLWPVWGVALAAATLAYDYRRRGSSAHCGRSKDSSTFGSKGTLLSRT